MELQNAKESLLWTAIGEHCGQILHFDGICEIALKCQAKN